MCLMLTSFLDLFWVKKKQHSNWGQYFKGIVQPYLLYYGANKRLVCIYIFQIHSLLVTLAL